MEAKMKRKTIGCENENKYKYDNKYKMKINKKLNSKHEHE